MKKRSRSKLSLEGEGETKESKRPPRCEVPGSDIQSVCADIVFRLMKSVEKRQPPSFKFEFSKSKPRGKTVCSLDEVDETCRTTLSKLEEIDKRYRRNQAKFRESSALVREEEEKLRPSLIALVQKKNPSGKSIIYSMDGDKDTTVKIKTGIQGGSTPRVAEKQEAMKRAVATILKEARIDPSAPFKRDEIQHNKIVQNLISSDIKRVIAEYKVAIKQVLVEKRDSVTRIT